MKMAEKELGEIEKKRLAAEAIHLSDSANPARVGKSLSTLPAEVNRERLGQLAIAIEEEARKLSLVRAELLKAKSSGSGTIHFAFAAANKQKDIASTALASSVGAAASSMSSVTAVAGEASKAIKAVPEPDKKSGTRGGVVRPVPEEYIPDLCRSVGAFNNVLTVS